MRAASAALCSFALAVSALGAAAQGTDDWALGAEASFLTREERRRWNALPSDAAREEFRRAYWQRRDPTPGTDVNEFQEMVLARIRAADERFGTGDLPGSRTARGVVCVVLGPPAVIRATAGPLDMTPRRELPGTTTLPRTALDTTGWEEWIYNREQNGELLKVLRRPIVEIAFVVERGADRLQKPGIFAAYREAIARSTIARP